MKYLQASLFPEQIRSRKNLLVLPASLLLPPVPLPAWVKISFFPTDRRNRHKKMMLYCVSRVTTVCLFPICFSLLSVVKFQDYVADMILLVPEYYLHALVSHNKTGKHHCQGHPRHLHSTRKKVNGTGACKSQRIHLRQDLSSWWHEGSLSSK